MENNTLDALVLDPSEIAFETFVESFDLDKYPYEATKKSIVALLSYIENNKIEGVVNCSDSRVLTMCYKIILKAQMLFPSPSLMEWTILYAYIKEVQTDHPYKQELLMLITLYVNSIYGDSDVSKEENDAYNSLKTQLANYPIDWDEYPMFFYKILNENLLDEVEEIEEEEQIEQIDKKETKSIEKQLLKEKIEWFRNYLEEAQKEGEDEEVIEQIKEQIDFFELLDEE